MKILQNQIKCNSCGDTPYSAYRHDYKRCECGAVAVDGGMSYLRRSAADLSGYEDISVTMEDGLYEACIEALVWSEKNNRNELGALCALVRAIRESGYEIKEKK